MATTTTVTKDSATMASPYKLDVDQTLKASQALLNHFRSEAKRLRDESSKRDLLRNSDANSDSEDSNSSGNEQPIWLNLSTKQHIVDKHRLALNKIKVPHSLTKSKNLTICLITADPQRGAKDVVADPAFPSSISSKISKIIGYAKLKARYSTFESCRQLRDEYDIFLADERIIARLPETLGKVFYKGTAKRPIPVSIALQERMDGKVVRQEAKKKMPKGERIADFAPPAVFAKEVESTIDAVPVYLKPGVNVAIRVGLSGFTPQQLAENIAVVVQRVIEKHVVKGWKNVKRIDIKSPTSVAMPIWLADDLWTGEEDVIEDVTTNNQEEPNKSSEAPQKRKRNPASQKGPQVGSRKKTRIAQTVDVYLEQDHAESAARKAKLAQQKTKAFKTGTTVATTA